MFVRLPAIIAGLLFVLVVTQATSAQEPDHFFEFFKKDQGIFVPRPSTNESEFLSAIILAPDDLQRIKDARTLSSEELAKKYPDLKPKIDEATAEAVRTFGNGLKFKASLSVRSLGSAYRVLVVKPSYLLVEDTNDPPRKTVFAMDKFKKITWSAGLQVSMQPDRSAAGQE